MNYNELISKSKGYSSRLFQIIKSKKEEGYTEISLENILDYYIQVEKKLFHQVLRGQKSKEEFLLEVHKFLNLRQVSIDESRELLEQLQKYLWGYHVLEELIEDEDISDIKVMNYNNIRVKRKGKREQTSVSFQGKEEYCRFVDYIAVRNRVNLSDMNAVQSFTDKTSNKQFILRFNITTDFVNSVDVPYLHIRKIAKHKRQVEELIEMEMMPREIADYLVNQAKTGNGMLFAGKGASGKTTLMNALIDQIPHNYSGLAIQENEELFSNEHPEFMFQHVVENKGEGKIQYELKDLARNGLLTDLDYFVIGEIKGNEALYFLNASFTGHRCWASVHGNSSTQAMDKLVDYVKYEGDYAKSEVLKMLQNLSCIVFLENFQVKEIAEVVGWDEEKQNLAYKRIL